MLALLERDEEDACFDMYAYEMSDIILVSSVANHGLT